MAVNWTEEQQKVIRLRDRSILVSAAAGSGKTAVLVQRILEKLLDPEHPADIDRMLIMTFTRAAAGEMKERITKALENALYEDPDNEHLQKQMNLIHAAQITTIDGFCSWLLRNYFHLIGLDPGYRMLEEGEAKLLRSDTLEELLNGKYEEGDPDFLEFAEYFSPGRSDDRLPELILRLYEMAMSHPEPEEWLTSCEEGYAFSSLREFSDSPVIRETLEEAGASLQSAEELLQEGIRICLSPYGPWHYEEALQNDREQINRIRSALSRSFDEAAESFDGFSWARLSTKRPKEIDELKKEQVKDLREEVKGIVNGLRTEVFSRTLAKHYRIEQRTRKPVGTLLHLVRDFDEAFTRKKRERGVLDFTDLEHLALEILREKTEEGSVPTEAARELSEKYDEVMIDEYQDSNRLQEAIAEKVCGWAKKKNNLFMVGDVKQSIYRFRLACPELFMEKYKRFSAEDSPEQKIDLHRNFRSRPQVLSGVNYLFRSLMGEDLGGITYGETEALYPGAEYPGEASDEAYCTELLLAETGQEDTADLPEEENEEKAARNNRELEALLIARRIRQLVREEKLYDREKKEMRPAEYKDIVILLRSFAGWAETFRDVLASQGIPVYVASRTGYFQTTEIRTILNYLRVCDNPRQDIPLQGALMSPLGKCTAEDLARLRAAFPEEMLWDSVTRLLEESEKNTAPELLPVRKKLEEFCSLLARCRRRVPYTPVHALIQTILSETEYDLICGALPDGARKSANLSMLVEMAREYEKTSYRGLFNFIRYIEQMQKYEVDYGEANLTGDGNNAVQIMTVHKSKGLEFPVVFVSGLGKRFNQTEVNAQVLFHADLGVGVQAVETEKGLYTETLQRRRIRRRLRMDNLGEELRVLYVALTRAKEKLIMTGTIADAGKKLRSLERHIGREQDLLPFQTRLNARSSLDLVLPALAGHRCMEEIFKSQDILKKGREALREDPSVFRFRIVSGTEIAFGVLTDSLEEEESAEMLRNWDPEQVFDPELRQKIAGRFAYQYPDALLRSIPVKVSVSELKKRSGHEDSDLEEAVMEERDPVPLIPRFALTEERKEEALRGAGRGTAYHRVMECLDYDLTENEGDIEEQIGEMVKQERLSEEQRSCVRPGDILRFVQSALGQRMKKAALSGRLLREQPFMIARKAVELDPSWTADTTVLVQGIIDAYFLEEEDLILVDYKTDRAAPGEEQKLIDLYHVQLEDYACALERLTGRRVKETFIYSFTLGKAIPLDVRKSAILPGHDF